MRSRYLTINQIDNNLLYYEINNKSTYSIQFLCIEQDFVKKYLNFFIFLKDKFPIDIFYVIFSKIYYKELNTLYYYDNKNINNEHSVPQTNLEYDNEIFANNFQHKKIKTSDLNLRYDNYVNPKGFGYDSFGCDLCEIVRGSLYCYNHMNCKDCGFNRRFKECNHECGQSKYNKYVQLEKVKDGILILEPTKESEWPKESPESMKLALITPSKLENNYKNLLNLVNIQNNIIESMTKCIKDIKNKLTKYQELSGEIYEIINQRDFSGTI
jgi:hypothetical protein